ncbi:MAG: contractile injection system tape measure protein, partial [Pseudomonadota bacterium]
SIIDGLLNAIISHWNSLGSTSIEGLRTTFIQREGQLLDEEKQWQLSVIPGAFDMLLDQIPWSFQTIKFPWMDKPLFVTWR